MENFCQILIYIMIMINCARVFFSKRIKTDSLVIISPLCVVLSVLNIIALGFSALSFQLFVISILCLISNIHAILRYSEKLYIDTFSFVMRCLCIVVIILSIVSSIVFLIYAPAKVSDRNVDVKISKTFYTGDFSKGFTPSEIFSKKNLYITEFIKSDSTENPKKVVVFFPDKRGETKAYDPYLQYLANYGLTVCSNDFFVDTYDWGVKHPNSIFRSYELIKKSLKEGSPYDKKEFSYYNLINCECNTIISILDEKYGSDCNYYFIADSFAKETLGNYAFENQERVSGIFFLDSLNEYKTPGYGCVEMTNPYIANKLNVKIDRTGFIPKYMALKTYQKIEKIWGKK